MLNDEISAALHADADEAGAPPADLLRLVRRRAARQRHRKAAALGFSGVLIAGVALTGGFALSARTQHDPTVLAVANTPTIEPSSQTEDPANDGLTGSLCDDPGSKVPARYLDWPCATAQKGTFKAVEGVAYNDLNYSYTGLTAPRIRLLADDTQNATYGHHGFYELWDADHPETPAVVNYFNGGGGSEGAAPAGDPSVYSSYDNIAVKAPITSVTLEPQGKTFTVSHGIVVISDADRDAASTIVGHDPQGQTQPGWTVPLVKTQDVSDTGCAGHAGIGTCSGYGATPKAPPTDLCATPTGDLGGHYLDWPCATAVDAETPSLVAKAEQEILGSHRGIRDPQIRLLGDTRSDHERDGGSTATVIELWDGAGNGPALVGYATATNAGGGGFAPANDPALISSGGIAVDKGIADQLFFARAGIAGVTVDEDGTLTTAAMNGGVASLLYPAGDPMKKYPTWKFEGKDAAGATVITLPFDSPAYVDPCNGVISSTCVPAGAEPSFAPSASAGAGASPGTSPSAGGSPTP